MQIFLWSFPTHLSIICWAKQSVKLQTKLPLNTLNSSLWPIIETLFSFIYAEHLKNWTCCYWQSKFRFRKELAELPVGERERKKRMESDSTSYLKVKGIYRVCSLFGFFFFGQKVKMLNLTQLLDFSYWDQALKKPKKHKPYSLHPLPPF